MVFDTYHQKFRVILSKLERRWRTPSDPLIGSDKSLTALEVKRAHDKGQAQAGTLPAKTAHAVHPTPKLGAYRVWKPPPNK